MAKKDKKQQTPEPDFAQDLLLKEVDEEVRAERLSLWWQRFGSWLVGGAVVVVLATIGYEMRHTMLEEEAQTATAQLIQVEKLRGENKNDEALTQLPDINSLPKTTQSLAALQAAQVAQMQGNTEEATAYYRQVADQNAAPALQNIARLQLGELDAFAPQSPFYATAQELKAAQLYEAGKKEEARTHLSELLLDPDTPATMRRRVEELLQAYQ